MTTPSEISVRGGCARIDAVGYGNDPQYKGHITVVNEQDIKIPLGLTDLVSTASSHTLWQRQIVATCHATADGSLELLDINEADDDTPTPDRDAASQPSLPLPQPVTARPIA